MVSTDRLERLADRTLRGSDDSHAPTGLVLLAGAIAAAVLSPGLWIVLRAFDLDVVLRQAPGRALGATLGAVVGNVAGGIQMLAQPSMLEVLFNSVLLAGTVTVASVLLGVPLAVLTVQTDLPFSRAWTVLVSLPLVIPSYIGAFAFVSAFGPKGALADALAPLGIASLPPIYGFAGAALVLTLFVYPYVFITTRASLLSFDTTLMEAARTLDHTRWQAFRRVTLPQIAPGVAAGALLVALYTISDFGTPAIMHFDVFTRMIYVRYTNFLRDSAALLSMELLAVTLVILAIESRIGGGNRRNYAGGGMGASVQIRLGKWKLPALAFCVLVVLLCLGIPLGVLFMWLARTGPGYETGSLTFDVAYGWHSVYASALTALGATLVAVPVAYLSARYRSTLSTLFDRATYIGYAMPGVVLGLSLVFFGVRYAPFLYQTLPLLIFAYVVRFLPQAVGSTRSSVLQVDPKLTEAARTLGTSHLAAFRRVTLPLIAPGVVAGAALVFLTTMKELPATLLLHPTGFRTLVSYIWLVQSAGYYGKAALPALILVGISALSMGVILARERNV
ncbi:MAG: ABC transporter permease [Haloarculaceae archaeon]